MDQQPIAYIDYRLVRILAYHRNTYTCVVLKDQRIRNLDTDPTSNTLIITTKLDDGVERFIWENTTYYVKDCYFHREDGPAIIYAKPNYKNEFWLSGKKYETVEDYFETLTPEQKEKAIFNINELKL